MARPKKFTFQSSQQHSFVNIERVYLQIGLGVKMEAQPNKKAMKSNLNISPFLNKKLPIYIQTISDDLFDFEKLFMSK